MHARTCAKWTNHTQGIWMHAIKIMINDKSIMWACSPLPSPTQQLFSSWWGRPWTVVGDIKLLFFRHFFFPGCLNPSSSSTSPLSTFLHLSGPLCSLVLLLVDAAFSSVSYVWQLRGFLPLPSGLPAFTRLVRSCLPHPTSIQSDRGGLHCSLQFNAKISLHWKGDICPYMCSLENCQTWANITSCCFPCCWPVWNIRQGKKRSNICPLVLGSFIGFNWQLPEFLRYISCKE